MILDRTVRFAGGMLALMLALVLWIPMPATSSAGTAWLPPDAQAALGDDLSGALPCQAVAYGERFCCHRHPSVQTAAPGAATEAEKLPPTVLPTVVTVAPLSRGAPPPVVRSAAAGPPLFLLFLQLRI